MFTEELIDIEEELNDKVRQLNKAINELTTQKEYIYAIYNSSNTAIMVWDLNGIVKEVNDFFCEMIQIEKDCIIGQKWFDIIMPTDEMSIIFKLIDDLKSHKEVKNFINKVITQKGNLLDVIWNNSIIKDPITNKLLVVSFGMDITLEREKEKIALKLAYNDNLTGFKNKKSFEEDVSELINMNVPFTLYYIDIDNFRRLNDIYGYDYGDVYLKSYAKSLDEKIYNCTFYRCFGDEFMILEKTSAQDCIDSQIKNILKISDRIWKHEHIEYYLSIHMGITTFPYNGLSFNEVFKNVDIALQHAKESSNSNICQYDSILQKHLQDRLDMETLIYNALLNNAFRLNFQPIFDLNTNEIKCIETLLRVDLNGNEINIGEVIQVAEETGQILKVDRWVVKHTFEFISKKLLDENITVAINLSAKTFETREIIDFLKLTIDEYKIDPTKVVFEITEHSLIKDIEMSLQLIMDIKEMGFKISLDDFGTQYSSLNYLSKIPFDSLKIDKSYVDQITSVENSYIVVEEIIRLSNRFGIKTIAEGVEEVDQLDMLIELGCDYVQGYLFSKPVSDDLIIEKIAESKIK